MIIKFYDLKKKFNKNINFYLLYGNNTGLIDETVEDFFKANFSKNVLNYEESEVVNNPEILQGEILNQSFFHNDKLIIVSRVTDKLLKIIEELIDKTNDDTKVILKAGILEKKSKIRSYFEKDKNAIIVPFYEDNNQSLYTIANNFFKIKKISISQQSINLIVERSRGNRINLKNELEKIEFFSKNKDIINTEDIFKITNLSENYDVSELVEQCLVRNKRKTLNILNENSSLQENNITIVKTFLFKLKRLRKLKKELEIKKNVDSVITSYKPPIFWKDKDFIKKQLSIWSASEIQKFISELNNLEILIKKNSQISNYIVNNFILEKIK